MKTINRAGLAYASSLLGLVLFSGCTSATVNIDTANDTAGAVAGLDYRDLRKVANTMLNSLMASGRLNHPDPRAMYVLAISKVKNDTMQKFDTDTLTLQITEGMMESGRVTVTSAIAASEDNRDELLDGARSLRNDGEFNQSTVAKKGQMVAPDLSLKGKITQKEIRMDKGLKQIEYYFMLQLTDIKTGLQLWQKTEFLGKRADKNTPSW